MACFTGRGMVGHLITGICVAPCGNQARRQSIHPNFHVPQGAILRHRSTNSRVPRLACETSFDGP